MPSTRGDNASSSAADDEIRALEARLAVIAQTLSPMGELTTPAGKPVEELDSLQQRLHELTTMSQLDDLPGASDSTGASDSSANTHVEPTMPPGSTRKPILQPFTNRTTMKKPLPLSPPTLVESEASKRVRSMNALDAIGDAFIYRAKGLHAAILRNEQKLATASHAGVISKAWSLKNDQESLPGAYAWARSFLTSSDRQDPTKWTQGDREEFNHAKLAFSSFKPKRLSKPEWKTDYEKHLATFKRVGEQLAALDAKVPDNDSQSPPLPAYISNASWLITRFAPSAPLSSDDCKWMKDHSESIASGEIMHGSQASDCWGRVVRIRTAFNNAWSAAASMHSSLAPHATNLLQKHELLCLSTQLEELEEGRERFEALYNAGQESFGTKAESADT
ncbi:hypothetical protein DB88DRAFT_511913 [Papiliotrema laurentii]|uniref:Uncharacterized protein n=1 Tax=Papiliotrema laurentii TaxID=5418 RepID=A0AAD9CVM9_PAPLA|nr:hypothetical protein DB88DRAFT_511913 [Papiliotrema laurentii]